MKKRHLVHQMYNLSQMFSRAAEVQGRSVMSKSEFKILFHVWKTHREEDKMLTSRELATLMNVSSPAISRTVKGLVQKEWLIQEDDPDDRRNIFLKLSDEGKENYERAIQHMENSMKIIFDEFTEEEIRVFLDTGARLTKVLNKIKEESEE